MNLTRANLITAHLDRVQLTGADLTDGDLTGTRLTGANLTGANLSFAVGMLDAPRGATWDRETQWPLHVASVVAEQSDEVHPGVFQVRGGPSPGRSGRVQV